MTYSKDGALIKDGDKQSGISVPDHAYDNDASLFIWRTLPFAEGYQGKYVTMITNRRTRQEVTLKVRGKETVRVPAGEFTRLAPRNRGRGRQTDRLDRGHPGPHACALRQRQRPGLRARKGALAQRAIYHLGLVSCTIAAYRQGRL